MAHSTWHVYGSVFVYLFMCIVCQNQNKDSDRRPWYETKPAVSMDYKVHIDAGKDDCFFQYVQPGANLYISIQVIRGGKNGMAGFIVRHPTGEIVHPYKMETNSEYADKTSTGGYYDVCIDNQSSFASILVNIYISVVKYDDWYKYIKEIEDLHLDVQNFTHVVSILERNIHDMLYFQSHTRSRESRDMALLLDNEAYVQNWSIAQIIVTILTCTFQVYFVRKLFDIKTGSIRSQI